MGARYAGTVEWSVFVFVIFAINLCTVYTCRAWNPCTYHPQGLTGHKAMHDDSVSRRLQPAPGMPGTAGVPCTSPRLHWECAEQHRPSSKNHPTDSPPCTDSHHTSTHQPHKHTQPCCHSLLLVQSKTRTHNNRPACPARPATATNPCVKSHLLLLLKYTMRRPARPPARLPATHTRHPCPPQQPHLGLTAA